MACLSSSTWMLKQINTWSRRWEARLSQNFYVFNENPKLLLGPVVVSGIKEMMELLLPFLCLLNTKCLRFTLKLCHLWQIKSSIKKCLLGYYETDLFWIFPCWWSLEVLQWTFHWIIICHRRVLHGARHESKNGIAQKMYATNCSIQ
jgi:hypothetical protein